MQLYLIITATWKNTIVEFKPMVKAMCVVTKRYIYSCGYLLAVTKGLYICGSPLATTIGELYIYIYMNFEIKLFRHTQRFIWIRNCGHNQRFNVKVDYAWPQLKVLIYFLDILY